MPDMLVKLYELQDHETVLQYEKRTGITVRRAIAPEKHVVTEWVAEHFGAAWKSEVEVAFARSPITCLIAAQNDKLLGFACYDATMKGYFGPTGVHQELRGRGIGKMLFIYSMQLMQSEGYGYAIIGSAGPVDFYSKCVGATIIEGSVPGIYKGMLK